MSVYRVATVKMPLVNKVGVTYTLNLYSGRGAARLARTVRGGEVVGSNPAAPTTTNLRNCEGFFNFSANL